MKTAKFARCAAGSLLVLSTLAPQLPTFAQGSLTPPGPPAPTMKTLDQIAPRTPISSLPYNITTGGSYYLTTNLSGVNFSHGIIILTGDVTLDLNGFGLIGVPGSLSGVFVSGGSRTNITVRNGAVRGWGRDGIAGGTAYNLICERLAVSANGQYGISSATGGTIRDCVLQNNTLYGIYINNNGLVSNCNIQSIGSGGMAVTASRVTDCVVQGSGNWGIFAAASTVSGCVVKDHLSNGIHVDASNSLIVGNNCIGNNTGIYINNGNNNRIEGNHVSASGSSGIEVNSGSTNNVVIRNTVSGSGANNYLGATNNDFGPVGDAATSTSPWANISH